MNLLWQRLPPFALVVLLLGLSACGPTGAASVTPPTPANTTSASPPPPPTPAPVTPPAPQPAPPVGAPQRQIGSWVERIVNPDGAINIAEYRAVAQSINTAETVDYRLGPKYADFDHSGETGAPRIWSPDPTERGLWPYGTQPARNPGEPEKCVPSNQLPGSDGEEIARGFNGAGWQTAGQHIFVPDNPQDPNFKYGISNTRSGDGNLFNTGGLCLRMFASFYGDWWNRNNISNPANPETVQFANQRGNLPLTPVAITRGRANASQVGFAAFKDGTIIPIVTGNSVAGELGLNGSVKLRDGLTPTAMAVTSYNEFLVVAAWDTQEIKGKLVFVALRGLEMGTGDRRPVWGLPNAWTIRNMKILGEIDLPFAAPTSLDVSNHVVLGNPRGITDNDPLEFGDLSRQTARDRWRNVPWTVAFGEDEWRQTAQKGYAIAASRAENKVAFIDMAPLYQHYRDMYLTTQANYDQTVNFSDTDPNRFPYSFSARPAQTPTLITVLDVPQPTSVSAGVQTKTVYGLNRSQTLQTTQRDTWSGEEIRKYFARTRAFVASMDGTVRIYNVEGINLPGSPVGRQVPSQPVGQFRVGRNPTFGFASGLSTAPDDLFVVSRADRSITFAWPTGEVRAVLRDQRMIDPVYVAVSYNQAGYGGAGEGKAVNTPILTVVDFDGKGLLSYGMDPDRGVRPELYPYRDPNGPVKFLFGSKTSTPGKPFQYNFDEVI